MKIIIPLTKQRNSTLLFKDAVVTLSSTIISGTVESVSSTVRKSNTVRKQLKKVLKQKEKKIRTVCESAISKGQQNSLVFFHE